MEDEECLPENSSLRQYLQDLGFSDLQLIRNTAQNPSSIRFDVTKPKSKIHYLETIDEDVIDQISIIVSTQMLFEEDISNVEKLLSNFKVVKNGMLKSMFKDFLGVAVIFLGLCLYFIIGYYSFFIVSSFYAFFAANYLMRKHNNRSRLEKLTSILQANFILLKKTVKFIEENKLIETNNEYEKNSVEFIEGFSFYKNFKSDFLISINEMINILVQSTKRLINQIPLYDYIENPEYYLCNNFNKDYGSTNLSKLFEIYLLIQSEFLQRLILSLVPNITLSAKDGFYELNKILTETCVNLLKIKNKLNKKFKFVFLNGIHTPKTSVPLKLPLKNKLVNNYIKEFFFNIHETSKNLQNLLLKCRILEENAVLDKIPVFVEEELVKIHEGLNACQKNISDSFILLNKENSGLKSSDKCVAVRKQHEEEVNNSREVLNKIMVGYTDLDPKIEDDIFEAYFTNENVGRNLSDTDYFNLENNLEKKLEKEYCKNVMKELKLKLVDKAKCRRKRERELLKKKGIIDENESDDDAVNSEGCREFDNETEKSLLQNKDRDTFFEYQENFTKDKNSDWVVENPSVEVMSLNYETNTEILKINRESQNECEILSSENQECVRPEIENLHEVSSVPMINKGFLNDINQARQKIFKLSPAVEEELFCDSSSSEDFEPLT